MGETLAPIMVINVIWHKINGTEKKTKILGYNCLIIVLIKILKFWLLYTSNILIETNYKMKKKMLFVQ